MPGPISTKRRTVVCRADPPPKGVVLESHMADFPRGDRPDQTQDGLSNNGIGDRAKPKRGRYFKEEHSQSFVITAVLLVVSILLLVPTLTMMAIPLFLFSPSLFIF
jgi:hypothetical protein